MLADASGWCARRESNPHILRYWNLNPARLPIPPRARGPSGRAYSKDGATGNPPQLSKQGFVETTKESLNAAATADSRNTRRAEPARPAHRTAARNPGPLPR